MPLLDDNRVEIEIISDKFSLEFFVNGLSASFSLFPENNSDGLELNITSDKCKYTKSVY